MAATPLAAGLISAALLLIATAAAAFYYFHLLKRRRGTGGTGDPERALSSSKVADGEVESKKGDGGPTGVRRYSWGEIEELTAGFSSAVVGQGGFSTVYLAKLPDTPSSTSSLGAVKVHSDSERLHRAFKQELDVLLRVRHRSIVTLIGYCDEKEEGALVFEYVPNGTLHDKLHGSHGVAVPAAPLPWGQRMSIALEVAEALEHLHEGCDLQIVHGDIKPSNILLDDGLRSKLCDFGSAKMGFSSAVVPQRHDLMVGSPCYADPHYLRTGIASKKSDVYSFGVLLLELVTGKEAFCSETARMLTAEVADGVVVPDGRLLEECTMEEAAEVAALAIRCVGEQPSLRPSMGEVAQVLRKLPSSISTVDEKSKGGS